MVRETFPLVKERAEKAGALYFDTFGMLSKRVTSSEARSLYLTGDMHFNARDYEIWGEELAHFIAEHLQGALHSSSH